MSWRAVRCGHIHSHVAPEEAIVLPDPPVWIQWLVNLIVIPLVYVVGRNFVLVRRDQNGKLPSPDEMMQLMEPFAARMTVLESVTREASERINRMDNRILFLEQTLMSKGGGPS